MIKKSSRPLIMVPQNPEGDAIASALALFSIIKKMGKAPEIACSTGIPEKFSFLPDTKSIAHTISADRVYKISLNVESNEIKELSYEQVGSMLNVYVGIKDDNLKRESLNLEPSKFKYDLLIVTGASDLESLGRLYLENTELFFQTPIINIDHRASNEYFGAVNLVEVTSPSTSEIIADLSQTLTPKSIDDKLATLLLAGVISETNNFQNPNINPQTFILAASLLTAGADQEEIIKYFYKTKPLAVLKLIGQIINNMNFDPDYHLAWAHLSQEDFKKNEANPRDIDMAINELVNNSKDIDMLLLVYQDFETVIGNIWLDKKYDVKRLATELGGERKNNKIIISGTELSISEFEQKISKKLKAFMEESNKKSE